jgi:hypothetical protein
MADRYWRQELKRQNTAFAAWLRGELSGLEKTLEACRRREEPQEKQEQARRQALEAFRQAVLRRQSQDREAVLARLEEVEADWRREHPENPVLGLLAQFQLDAQYRSLAAEEVLERYERYIVDPAYELPASELEFLRRAFRQLRRPDRLPGPGQLRGPGAKEPDLFLQARERKHAHAPWLKGGEGAMLDRYLKAAARSEEPGGVVFEYPPRQTAGQPDYVAVPLDSLIPD